MSDIEARLACASSFILQSPPGEVNDVFNDVRALVGDDAALEAGILPALQIYNVEQLIVADLPDKQQLMICSHGSVQDDTTRFIEPSTAKAWLFDHLRLSASDPVDIQVDAECEAIRVELEKAASNYGKEHFTEGVSKVFTSEQRKLKPTPKPKAKPAPVEAVPATTEDVSGAEPVKEVEGSNMQEDSTIAPAGETKTDAELIDPETEGPAGEASTTAAVESVTTSEEAQEEAKVDTIDTDMVEKESNADQETPKDTTMESDEQTEEPRQASEETSTTAAPVSEQPEQIQEEQEEMEEETPAEPSPKRFSLYFVGNKYNPSNYWTGRWRSSYELDLSQGRPKLHGSIQINVHLFEQGNVQLATNFTPTIQLPESLSVSSTPAEIAKVVVKGISKVEEEYQLELNEAYRDMADRTFRNLRRVLPVTRQKMDWAKVASYKIGRTLGGE